MKTTRETSSQSASTIFLSLLNITPMLPMRRSPESSLSKLSEKSAPLRCSPTPRLSSIPQDLSSLEDPKPIQDSLEEKSSLIPTVVGLLTVVVLSQEKTPLKSTDQHLTTLDMLPSHLLPLNSLIEFSFKSLMLSV